MSNTKLSNTNGYRAWLVNLTLIGLTLAMPGASLGDEQPRDAPLTLQRHAIRTTAGPAAATLAKSPRTALGFIRVEWPDGTHASSAISAHWKLQVGDLDGDGIDELIVGTWSTRGPHAYLTRRTIWVLKALKGGIAPVWRGSMLPDPFDDFEMRRRDGKDLLITHPTGPGLPSTHYRWTGFGFAVEARAARPPVRIAFVGDVAIARYEGKERVVVGPTSEALETGRSADLVVANLETTVAEKPDGAGGLRPLLQVRETDLDLLTEWGINAVTRANNHVMDSGQPGRRHTTEALRSRGIKDLTNSRIVIGRNTIHLMTATLHPARFPGPMTIAPDDEQPFLEMVSKIAQRRATTTKLVMSLHGGAEGKSRPTPRMQGLTKELLKRGVDVVVWHGSHAPGKVESTEDGIVAWGLGDFALKRKNKGCALYLDLANGSLSRADGPNSCQNR